MYDKSLFLKLNNYGYSDQNIEEIKNYLTTNETPEKVNTNAKVNDMKKNGTNLSYEMENYFIRK